MIRTANRHDLTQVVEIYNQAIEAGFQTAFTQPFEVHDKAEWFDQHRDSRYPLFVCVTGEQVAGWLKVNPYRQGRDALRYTVEISYFVHKDHRRQGIGQLLVEHALHACMTLGYKSVLAIILDRNIGSIKLLRKFGFKEWGYLPHVADFNGVESSHLYYGLKIGK